MMEEDATDEYEKQLGENDMQKQADSLPNNYWETLLAYDRFLLFFYQTTHWVTKGKPYYGDHLLFERLYNGVSEEIDGIGERAIGTTGNLEVVALGTSLRKMLEMLPTIQEMNNFFEIATNLEQGFIYLLEEIDKDERISVGTRDLLNGIASKHEEHIYLLKQRNLE